MIFVRIAKQCYHCQGIGHVQAACPTLRLAGANSGAACYHCGQPGHLAVRTPMAWLDTLLRTLEMWKKASLEG